MKEVSVQTGVQQPRFITRRRFEERFERDGSGFEGRRVVHGIHGVQSSTAIDRSPFVASRGELLRKVKHGLGFWVRWLGRPLLLAPLVWLAELGAGWLGFSRGYALVGLILWTCAFLGFLNLYVWASMLAFVRGRRLSVGRPFDEGGSDRLGLLPPPSRAIVGKLAGLSPAPGHELWRESWLAVPGVTRRASGGDHFVVVPDDGSPPIVCRLDAAPLLVGPCVTEELSSPSVRMLFPDTIASGSVQSVVLREGDAVALHAEDIRAIQRADHLELDGIVRGYRPQSIDDAPYRGGGAIPGRLATSGRDRPLRIRKLS